MFTSRTDDLTRFIKLDTKTHNISHIASRSGLACILYFRRPRSKLKALFDSIKLGGSYQLRKFMYGVKPKT
uniref:Uncharacterized protein n=1 Tax=Pararge aegeria TaxID=116150 RepID=S4PDD6_9NEOP